jgi:antitoxin VapB
MPLYIKDEETTKLVNELARYAGQTKSDAVKSAVKEALDRRVKDMKLRDRVALWRRLHPLPPATGEIADKAFFDELSGDL